MSKPFIKILTAVCLFCAVLLIGKSWLESRDAKTHLEADLAAGRMLLDAQTKALTAANNRITDRDKQTVELRKRIDDLRAQPIPVKEIVKEIPKYIMLESGPPATQTIQEPGKPTQDVMVFNESQSQDLRKFYLDCSQTGVELRACELDLQDFGVKEKAYQEKMVVLTKQRDEAVHAVKGGTFWQRLTRNAKWCAAGVVAGAVVGALTSR